MSQSVSRGGGNTSNPTASDPRSRGWCLTVNNYTEATKSHVSQLAKGSKHWIIAYEVGENGTPHIQAYFQFKSQKRFSTLKRSLPEGHWEKAKGNVQQNYEYCSKDGDFTTNIIPKVSREDLRNMVLKSYENVVWKEWQLAILNLIKEEPDNRTIHWIYEPTGNVGKSYLAKYLACHPGTILSSGKAENVFNQVNTNIDRGIKPKIVLCDIPRVVHKFISYQALEKLKDGCLYSGKYEGGICIFPAVHVLCFSNERPDVTTMSADRWRIYQIKQDTLFLKARV